MLSLTKGKADMTKKDNLQDEKNPEMLFNNLKEVLKATEVANLLGLKIKTIYDWHYRRKTRNIPINLFLKINKSLYIRTSVLRKWVISQNPTMG